LSVVDKVLVKIYLKKKSKISLAEELKIIKDPVHLYSKLCVHIRTKKIHQDFLSLALRFVSMVKNLQKYEQAILLATLAVFKK
jgi:hypothetical protein